MTHASVVKILFAKSLFVLGAQTYGFRKVGGVVDTLAKHAILYYLAHAASQLLGRQRGKKANVHNRIVMHETAHHVFYAYKVNCRFAADCAVHHGKQCCRHNG